MKVEVECGRVKGSGDCTNCGNTTEANYTTSNNLSKKREKEGKKNHIRASALKWLPFLVGCPRPGTAGHTKGTLFTRGLCIFNTFFFLSILFC